jgi:hypothetical protein
MGIIAKGIGMIEGLKEDSPLFSSLKVLYFSPMG